MDRASAATPRERDPAREARDAQWLVQLAAGGRQAHEAWQQLFDAYRARILRIGRRNVSLALREDLVQDVMITLRENASQYRPDRSAPAWIMRVALNKFRDALKRHDNSRTDHAEDGAELEAMIQPTAAVHQSVPQQVIDECRKRRWRAFEHERPKAAMALQLCHAQGWTIAELAELLGTTAGAAKVFLHTERAKARAALAPCEPGDAVA